MSVEMTDKMGDTITLYVAGPSSIMLDCTKAADADEQGLMLLSPAGARSLALTLNALAAQAEAWRVAAP